MIRGDNRYGGLARVIRFRPASEFPTSSIVATLDKEKNLLRVNAELFEQLDPTQKRRVLMTHDTYVEATTTRPVWA